jgi:hypothetical protein
MIRRIVYGSRPLKLACALSASWLLLSGPALHAQRAGPRAGAAPGRFFAGGSLGAGIGGLHPPAVPGACGASGEVVLSVQAGARIRGSLYLEGVAAGHTEVRGCGTLPLLLLDRVEASVLGRTITYPYASTLARALLEPGSESAPFRPRLFAGPGWIWGANEPFLTFGGGVSTGGDRGRLVLEIGGVWLTHRTDILYQTYRSGSLVQTSVGEKVVKERMLEVRLGFQRRLGQRSGSDPRR